MSHSVKLQDVADLAGVSIGTASQALNYRPNVAPETRARVIDAAHTLGYPVKTTPTEAVGTGIEIIGMLTKHDFGLSPEVNPFYSHVQAGVEEECRNHGISLMYANIEVDSSNRPVVWPSMLSEKRIDGLLLIGTFIEDTVGMLKQRLDLPIVLVDGYASHLPFDSVVIDNFDGTVAAIEYLIACGHRHIGLIGANKESPPGVIERQEGFVHCLAQHQLPNHYIEPSHLSQESGYEATRQLLERESDLTALFACNDLAAIGALQAARDMHIAVPEQLSIHGFDNIDLAGVVTPALTTVHVHKTWLGAIGVRQLIQRATQVHQPRIRIVVGTHLVERASVCTRRA